MKISRIFITLIAIAISFSFSIQDNKPLKTKNKASEALDYCKANKLNTDFCILVDMSVHSGKNRLFVYNFNSDSIISSGLCAHGCCNSDWGADLTKSSPSFSNVAESHCSSLGKYKIGSRGYSNWGIYVNYKLHGLDKSNSNAFKRLIVLHSWNMVENHEVFPEGTPEGWGCPSVSNEQMRYIDNLLKRAKTPVLLWIYK